MYFKLDLNANLDFFNFGKEDSIVFSFDEDDDKTTVIFRKPNLAEQKIGHNISEVFCEAMLEKQPNDSISKMFESLINIMMPKGIKKSDFPDGYYSRYFDDNNNLRENHVLPLFVMPKDFRAFEAEVREKLSDFIKRTIRILRWRTILEGKHNPIQSSRGFFWSFDKKHWKYMPSDGYIRISHSGATLITKEIQNEIQKLVVTGLDEPLGHAIFREAWKQRGENPRSSLILGMVAIEVGFKQCAGNLLPEVQWLVENLPSPPIPKMLSNFLPQLPTKLKINGKILPPPKSTMKLLDDAMKKRNQTTHKGDVPPQEDELEEMLLAIRDTLYLLDYYCGNEWAIKNLQEKTTEILFER